MRKWKSVRSLFNVKMFIFFLFLKFNPDFVFIKYYDNLYFCIILRTNYPPRLSQDAPASHRVDDATVVESIISLSALICASVNLMRIQKQSIQSAVEYIY